MGNQVKFLYDEYLETAETTIRLLNTNNDTILKSFYVDDFHISVSNSWNTGDSSIMGQLINTAAGFITSRTGKMLTGGLDSILKSESVTSGLNDEGKAFHAKLTSGLEKVRNVQNAHIFAAEDFYKTFKGSNVTFPLNLQVTLVSDEFNPDEDVYDKLRKIYDVSIGDYDSVAGGFVGIQMAPNGFKSSELNLKDGKIIEGTLKVVYGDPARGGFILDNVVISNVQATFSKTKVEISPRVYRPLYIDLQIMLEPAKRYSKNDIIRNLGLPKSKAKKKNNISHKDGTSIREHNEESIVRKKTIEASSRNKKMLGLEQQKDIKDMFGGGISHSLGDDGTVHLEGAVSKEQHREIKTKIQNLKELKKVTSKDHIIHKVTKFDMKAVFIKP